MFFELTIGTLNSINQSICLLFFVYLFRICFWSIVAKFKVKLKFNIFFGFLFVYSVTIVDYRDRHELLFLYTHFKNTQNEWQVGSSANMWNFCQLNDKHYRSVFVEVVLLLLVVFGLDGVQFQAYMFQLLCPFWTTISPLPIFYLYTFPNNWD